MYIFSFVILILVPTSVVTDDIMVLYDDWNICLTQRVVSFRLYT